MTSPMYTHSVPVFVQMLAALKTILSQANEHVVAKSIEPDALLQARLFPDMFPLLKQVQIAADFSRGIAARLAGVNVPLVSIQHQYVLTEPIKGVEKNLPTLRDPDRLIAPGQFGTIRIPGSPEYEAIVEQAAQVHGQRCLEQQDRQEGVKEGLGGDVEGLQGIQEVRHHLGRPGMQMQQDTQCKADQGQKYGVRQSQASSQRRHKGNQP